MGLRATVIKKYEVEYGNANGFNYDPETLYNIISDFCNDFYTGGEDLSTEAYWEIDKKEFADMLAELKEMPEDEFKERMKEDWFHGTFSDDKPYSKKYIVDVFEGYLAETPADSNYVRLGWL